MSQHPYVQFRLQSASSPLTSGQVHLLMTAHYQPSQERLGRDLKQRWVFAASGPLSQANIAQLEEGWSAARDEQVERALSMLSLDSPAVTLEALGRPKQPLSVQLKQLSNQLYSVEEPETTMELEFDIGELSTPPSEPQGNEEQDNPSEHEAKGIDEPPVHLVICLAQDSRHSPPPAREMSPFESVTLFFEDDSPLIWPWVMWAREVGAQLIMSGEGASDQLRDLITLSAQVRARQQLMIRPSLEGKLHAVVSINSPSVGRHPAPTNGVLIPLCAVGRRLAWLVSVEPKSYGEGARELLQIEVAGERHAVCDDPHGLEGFESHHPAVSFAQQLAQRGRILELIISSYLASDLRRVVHGLDQWLKLSVSLEPSDISDWIYGVKVKFLHLGRLEPHDFKQIIRHAIHAPYQLTADGEWEPTPLT